LRDAETLEAFELEMTTLRASEPLPEGDLDVLHYRAVHEHLFQDIYDWAGETRTVQTAKGGNLFCLPPYIDQQLDRLFKPLRGGPDSWGSVEEDFVQFAADFLAELNVVHAFREGNGRAQLSFLHLLGHAAGFPFDFTKVQRETFMPAMIASFHLQLAPLTAELRTLLVSTPDANES
jgi:cell filamentation protein